MRRPANPARPRDHHRPGPASAGRGPGRWRATAPKTQHDRIVAHWTKERIANAIPRDFVKVGGDRPRKAGNPKPRSRQAATRWRRRGRRRRVVDHRRADPGPDRARRVHDGRRRLDLLGQRRQRRRSGRLFDGPDGRPLRDRRDERRSSRRNWMFIPAFDTAPTYTCSASAYGCWTAVGLVVHNQFATAGSFNDQAVTNDWALAIVGPGGKSGIDAARLDGRQSYPIGVLRRVTSRRATSCTPSAIRPPASTTARTSSTAPATIIQDSRHREPDVGDGLRHDRWLVRRAVAVRASTSRPGAAR